MTAVSVGSSCSYVGTMVGCSVHRIVRGAQVTAVSVGSSCNPEVLAQAERLALMREALQVCKGQFNVWLVEYLDIFVEENDDVYRCDQAERASQWALDRYIQTSRTIQMIKRNERSILIAQATTVSVGS